MKLKNQLHKVFLLFVAIVAMSGSVISQIVFEGSNILVNNSLTGSYSSLSTNGSQTVSTDELIMLVSLDYGDVTNPNITQGTISVGYDLEYSNSSGSSVVLSGVLTVNSNDLRDAKQYIRSNFHSSSAVRLTVTSVTGTIPNNLRLKVDYQAKYKYHLHSSSNINYQSVDVISAQESKVMLSWSSHSSNGTNRDYFESYDLEILKVDPKKGSGGSYTLYKDWSKALKVRVDGGVRSYAFMPSSGEGYYVWRVRPIGSQYSGGATNVKNIGEWSSLSIDASLGHFYTPASTDGGQKFKVTSPSGNYKPGGSSANNEFFIDQSFEQGKNWSYMQQFAEGGKRKEVVTYANGLNQVRQTQTKLNSREEVVANATVYDYSGRGALNTMMAPTQKSYFEYDNHFMISSSTGGVYSAADFDTDGKMFAPNSVKSTSSLSQYYSDQNNGSMDGLYVADGEGQTYTRNVYTPDATGRVWVQGGVGDVLKLGDPTNVSGAHNTVVEYGSVAQQELDYIFGNEAPLAENVYKTSTRDPNGVTSINYMTKKGEVLATMLDGARVTDYSNRQTPVGGMQTITVEDALSEGMLSSDGYSSSSSKTLMVMGAGTFNSVKADQIDLTYSFSPSDFNLDCDNGCGDCDDICSECDYKVYITITSPKYPSDPDRNVRLEINIPPSYLLECGQTNAVYSNLLNGSAPGNITVSAVDYTNTSTAGNTVSSAFLSGITSGTIHLKPGVYTIEKEVVINDLEGPNSGQTYLDYYISELESQYENWTLTENCCGPYSLPAPQWSCDTIEGFTCADPNFNSKATALATTLYNYVQKEKTYQLNDGNNTYYKNILTKPAGDLLSNNISQTSIADFKGLITDWMCNEGIASNTILSCITLYGELLDNNITIAESMANGGIQNPGSAAGAFKENYDFLLGVFNCLSVSSEGPGCSYWIDIVAYGQNGSSQEFIDAVNLANMKNKGIIVTYNNIEHPGGPPNIGGIPSNQVKLVEVVHSGFYSSASFYQNHNTHIDKTQALAHDNCLRYLQYPNSTVNTGAEESDRAALAEMGCDCLEKIPDPMPEMKDEISNSTASVELELSCEEQCDDNKLMYEVAYNNAVLAANLANGHTDIYSDDWEDDIAGIVSTKKDCEIELMVAHCKTKCHKELHTYLEGRAKFDSETNNENSFSINGVGVDQISIPGTFKMSDVYDDTEVQQRLAKERQDIEDVVLGTAHYAPYIQNGYSVSDYQKEVKEEIVKFFYDNLERGMSERSNWVSPNPQHVLTPLGSQGDRMNTYEKGFSLSDGTGTLRSVTAQVNVIFREIMPNDFSDDEILELNVRLLCSTGAEIFSWAVAPENLSDLDHCGIFKGVSPSGYDVRYHIAEFYFDQFDNFHAVPSENMCWKSNSEWYHYNKVTPVDYTAIASIDISDFPWGGSTEFLLKYDDGTNVEYVMNKKVLAGSTYSESATLIADEINKTSSNPIMRASSSGNILKVYLYDEEALIEPSLIKLEGTLSGDFVNFDYPSEVSSNKSLDALNTCSTASATSTNCPYGYAEVIGNSVSSLSGIDVSVDQEMQVLGDDIADFWKTSFKTLIDSRQATGVSATYTTSLPTPVANETIYVEVYEDEKEWITSTAGLLRAKTYVEAQISEIEETSETGVVTKSRESIITMVKLTLENDCESGPQQPNIIAGFQIEPQNANSHDSWMRGLTIETGSYYDYSGASYTPYLYNNVNRKVFNDIVYNGSGEFFQIDLNPNMLYYTGNPPVGSVNGSGVVNVYQGISSNVEYLGCYVPFTYGHVSGNTYNTTAKSSTDYDASEIDEFRKQTNCANYYSKSCDVCVRYTFEVDNTPKDIEVPLSCEEIQQQNQNNAIRGLLSACLEDKTNELKENYKKCAEDYTDNLSMRYDLVAGQYTLYYYDRAGNLIETVPPLGVNLLNASQVSSVKTYRDNPAGNTPVYPSHTMRTKYRYNSLKQLVWQDTPDGGQSQFGYNNLGQLVLSQNSNQDDNNNKFSYTKYDKLGRVVEVGQVTSSSAVSFDQMLTNIILDPSLSGYTTSEEVYTQYGKSRNSTADITNQTGGVTSIALENVRNRVEKTWNDHVTTYYSYDMHGNVKKLIHDMDEIGVKILDYEYDLVSGNVNQVKYNSHYDVDSEDQFYHRYNYDEDNRITEVYTSKDGILWDRDAAYEYYLHGPLSRIELGQDEIQGVDYVYTLQGFLKSVNTVDLDTKGRNDKGADGAHVGYIDITNVSGSVSSATLSLNGSSTTYSFTSVSTPELFALALSSEINASYEKASSGLLNRLKAEVVGDHKVKIYATGEGSLPTGLGLTAAGVTITKKDFAINSTARDAFAMELGYFDGDYQRKETRIGKHSQYNPFTAAGSDVNSNTSLYNGNISTWLTNTFTGGLTMDEYDVKMNVYRYDALNRILNSDFKWWDGAKYLDDGKRYDESFTYDANGNIKTVDRYGTSSQGKVDDMDYQYVSPGVNNRLDHIEDASSVIPSGTSDFHMGTQGDENYEYDDMGNLVNDNYNDTEIEWNVIGKVKRVIGSSETIIFEYDGMGNRITKEVLTNSGGLIKKQYYLRDASGNVMAIYDKKPVGNNVILKLSEVPLYGSDRLGNKNMNQEIATQTNVSVNNYQFTKSQTQTDFNVTAPNPYTTVTSSTRTVGAKSYELKDHLGNVRSVVTDRKKADYSRKYLEFGEVNDGLNDYVRVNATISSFTNDLTIEMWVKPKDFANRHDLISLWWKNAGHIGVFQNGYLKFYYGDGTNYDHLTANVPLVENEWSHIAVVKNVTAGTVTWYINGVERGTDNLTYNAIPHTRTSFNIGQSWTGAPTLGGMDEVRIWSTPRTQEQIQSYMNKRLSGSESNLECYYPMDNIVNQVVKDYSSHGRDGILGTNSSVQSSDPTPKVEGVEYLAEVISAADYYAFGSLMPMRNASTDDYRYGFNGHEKDDEIKGTSNSLDFGARIYDPRIGKFLSVDPWAHKYSWQSPYAYFKNSPVSVIDYKGKGEKVFVTGEDADEATEKIDASTSLNITRGENGELHATGDAVTEKDKKLLEAINDDKKVVDLSTTKEKTYYSKEGTGPYPLVPAGYEGSTVIPNTGFTVAVQWINMEAINAIANIIGEKPGETLIHEINEAYIGATNDPGGNYTSSYKSSHKAAYSLDRVQVELEFNRVTTNQDVIILQARIKGTTQWYNVLEIPK
ncbi:hypothetical protein KFE94_07240 [bacterium SCSIO 12643]|nr:hypothetical protein KFE94_07240 [bacterium SCSIO 12643]